MGGSSVNVTSDNQGRPRFDEEGITVLHHRETAGLHWPARVEMGWRSTEPRVIEHQAFDEDGRTLLTRLILIQILEHLCGTT